MAAEVDALLTRVAAHGLPADRADQADPAGPRVAGDAAGPLDDDTFGALLAAARRERLVGLLAAATAEGALVVTDTQRAELHRAHREAMLACLALERLALAVHDGLAAAGVRHAFLKGVAWCHTHYPDPAGRAFGDVDVLVDPDGWDAAVAWCEARGARRHYPEPRPGFDRRFGRSVAWTFPDGLELDLHRTLAPGPLGQTIRPAEALDHLGAFPLGDRSLPRLEAALECVHAALHATLGDPVPRLTALRDVAQFALVTRPAPGAVEAWCRRFRVGAAVRAGLLGAARRFGLGPAPLLHWAATYVPGPTEDRCFHATVAAGGSYARQALATLPAVPGVRAKVAYALALAAPRRTYLDGDERGRLGRLRRVGGVLTGGGR